MPRLAMPLAVFGAGLLLETLGLQPKKLVYAIGTTLVAAWVAFVPWLREADKLLAGEQRL